MRRRWLLVAVILTVASGCDNVSWGGVEMRLVPPPEAAPAPVPAGDSAVAQAPLPALPTGPILLAGTRDGDRATLVVVGEVRGDALEPLPDEAGAPGFNAHFSRTLLAPGTELVLFAEGVRVGRLTVTESGTDERFCAPRPTATGTVELVPGAAGATRLLALRDDGAVARPFGDYRPLSHDYDQRVASLALGGEGIRRAGVAFPESLLESRADIQVFRAAANQEPIIAATFLEGDRLAVAAPGMGAWSIFVLGTAGSAGYEMAYLGFRPAGEQGKGAPRYFSHLDLNEDGSPEIVLDVFGSSSRWFATLSRRAGSWIQGFEDPCGTSAR